MPHSNDKILRVGILSPVTQIHPQLNFEYTAHLICRQLFEPLFDLPTTAQPVKPLLFDGPLEPLVNSEGGVTISARLLPGVLFSDSTPLSPVQILNSLQHEGFHWPVEVSHEADRIYFKLERPDTNFHLRLTQISCAPVLERERLFLGTGPFRALDYSSPDSIYLERNPHYRFTVPLDGIHFKTYPPDTDGSKKALTEAVESGEVDITTFLDREDLPRLNRVRKWLEPGCSICNLYINTEREPFNDLRVRKAIAMSVDRMKLAAACFGNALAFAARGPLPPLMGNWYDQVPYDRSAAQKLLKEVGQVKFSRVKIISPWGPRPYVPYPERVIALLQEMLGYLGIEFDVLPTSDLDDYRRQIITGDYDFALLGWIADTPDPIDFLEAIYASKSVPNRIGTSGLFSNESRWRNSEMDAALAAYRADPSENRHQNQSKIMEILTKEVPVLPLMYGPTIGAHAFRVKNFKPHPLGLVSLGEVDFW